MPERGIWDAAADRFSAAVTLHELVTGKRPSPGEGGRLTLAAERFDPSVRDALTAFFEKAFAPEVKDRWDRAEAMRHAWIACFDGRAVADPEAPAAEPAPEGPPTDEALREIAPNTSIAALPLSTRAQNALDRAGLLTAADLLSLPQNRLSAIRGAGRLVAQEIYEFRTRWEALAPAAAELGPAFFPGYRGADLMVHVALIARDADVLADAGLRTLTLVAAAPEAHLRALSDRHGLDTGAVRAVLTAENRAADERARPTTLEGWVETLFAGKGKRIQHVRALFGLEGPKAGQLGITPAEIASAFRLTAANIYIALAKVKESWAQHPALPDLGESLRAQIAGEGGAAPLSQVAEWLATQLPVTESDDATARLRAAALVRAACEADHGGLRLARLKHLGDAPWVLTAADLQTELEELGAAASRLSARPVPAGLAETARALREAIVPASPSEPGDGASSPLAAASDEKLVRLAAAASESAAASPRGELYPRGMPGARALELSASVLASGLSRDELRRRVAARYPDAEPLPDGPELDALVESACGLRVDATGHYLRPGDHAARSIHTSYTRGPAGSSVITPERRISEREAAAAAFNDRIQSCLERRGLLVLGVDADKAEAAARALTARFSLKRQSFDAAFLAALDEKIEEHGVDPSVVHETDAAGPADNAWSNLTGLCSEAAGAVADKLLPPKSPLLLTEPGLVHRYQLGDFLRTLVESSKHDDAEATVVLLPGQGEGVPTIEGETVVPGLLPGQQAWLPAGWLSA